MNIPAFKILVMTAALAASTPVFAQVETDAPSIRVSLAGVDLTSAEGAAIALDRIHAAASTVCGGQPDARLLGQKTAYEACRNTAIDGAVKSLDRPLITRMALGSAKLQVLASR